MKKQKNQHSQLEFWRERTNLGKLTLLDFKVYYKAIIIQDRWYWWKNRQTDQQNRRESPEAHCKHIVNVFLDKKTKTMWNKTSLFSNWCWNNFDTSTCTKNNTTLIPDLNAKCNTIILLEDIEKSWTTLERHLLDMYTTHEVLIS